MKRIQRIFDTYIIHFIQDYSELAARIALALIFIWFGLLKVIFMSPANELVTSLLNITLPFISFETFIVALGIFETLIGVLFLIPGWSRTAIVLLLFHMSTTALPLVMLPHITWQAFLIPTLEGQYIIKNAAIIALGLGVVAHFHPEKKETRKS